VEKALIDAGVPYEVVDGPGMPWQRGQRTTLLEKTGQKYFPAMEFEDGTVWKAQSKEIAAKIRAGELGTSAPTR